MRVRRRIRNNSFPIKSKFLLLTKRRLFILLLFGLGGYVIWWLVFSDYFSISDVSCTLDSGQCNEQILAEIDKNKGKSSLRFNTHELEDKISKSDPYISKAEVKIQLPNKIKVTLSVRQSFISLRTINSNFEMVVDDQGYVFRINNQPENTTPSVFVKEITEELGTRIKDENLLLTLKLVKLLNEQFITFSSLSLDKETATVVLSDDVQAIFSVQENITRQVTSLQRILSQATIDSEFKIIDIRYEKPIISTRDEK